MESFEVTDARGRKLRGGKIRVVDQAKLMAAVGPDNVENRPFMNLVLAAACVTFVGERPVHFPTSLREIYDRIDLLDEDGLKAINDHMQSVEGSAQTEAEAREFAKN